MEATYLNRAYLFTARKVFQDGSVFDIIDANFDLVHLIQNVQFGKSNGGVSIDHGSVFE